MSRIQQWTLWILFAAMLGVGSRAEAGPIKEGDTVTYEGIACRNGEPAIVDTVSENYINRQKILESVALIKLDVSKGHATGVIRCKLWSEVVGSEETTRTYTRHTFSLEGAFQSRELLEQDSRGFHLITIPYVYSIGGSTVEGEVERGNLFLAVFQGSKAPPGHEDLGGDFAIAYQYDRSMRATRKEFAQAVREGRLGHPMAILRRTDSTSTPPESTDPEEPPVKTVGDPSKEKWVVTERVGPVQARVPGGEWVPVVLGMVLGRGVEVKAGSNSTSTIQWMKKRKDGSEYVEATIKAKFGSTIRVREAEVGMGTEERNYLLRVLVGKVDVWIGEKMNLIREGLPVPKIPDAPDWKIPYFDVVTPTLRASSRQSAFAVAHDPETMRTSLSVTKGKVEIKPTGAGLPATTLAPGDRADVGPTRMTVDGPSGRRSFGEAEPVPEAPVPEDPVPEEPVPAPPHPGDTGTVRVPRFGASVGRATAADLKDSGHPGPAVVVRSVEDGPLKEHGIRAGDVLLSVNDRDVESPQALRDLLKSVAAGEEINCIFLRGEDVHVVTIGP